MKHFNPRPYDKPILCIDFDGVIHSYTSGWLGVDQIPDPPVPGVFEWLEATLIYFDVYVYSSRSATSDGRLAMFRYIKKYAHHLAGRLRYVCEKPRAFLTIDDRAICFKGDWKVPELDPKRLLDFVPWNKK
jgi:hypothetical protein